MTLRALPIWTAADGDTGPTRLPRTDKPIEAQVEDAFAVARRAGGANARVLVFCDVEWRTVARVRRKK